MKRKSFVLSFPQWSGMLLVCCAFMAMAWQMRLPAKEATQAEPALNGAWRLVKTTEPHDGMPEVVKILVDGSFTFATYDLQQKHLLVAGGGTFTAGKSGYTETFEYLTTDSTRVGTKMMYASSVKGNTWQVSYQQNGKKITQTWQRLDGGPGQPAPLSGAWRIRERETQPGQMTTIQQGPRKTVKWLSGTRFQWAAINTQTKQFFGTGGGTYTLQDGKYTEHIEFFSRDPKRVGMQISFDYEIKNGDWHHRGLSTAGNKIYEVWTRQK